MKRPRLAPLLALLFAGTTVWTVLECKRTAELAGWQEIEGRKARAEADAARADRDALQGRVAAAGADVERLERELLTTREQLQAMADVVKRRTELEESRARAAAAAEAAASAPMPEGVRLCLQALHECLRAEGFPQLRFLSARALDAEGLHDVEALDSAGDGFVADLLVAERVTAALDRATGRLELRFLRGTRSRSGVHEPLPKDGLAIAFAPVDGRMLEARLPALVHAEGAYRDGEVVAARPASDLDPATRLQWLDRFDRLLATAGTPEQWRVNRLRGLQDGHFLTVQLLGTDDLHRLIAGVDCARMCVEVDRTANVVSLRMFDGVLRREGVESSITAEGFRMLLPKVTPQQAADVMLGMVVTK